MNNFNNKIKDLKKYIHKCTALLQSQSFKRIRCITFNDLIYFSSLMNLKNESYSTVNSHLYFKDILNVSKNALVKKRAAISYTYFEKLNNLLIKFIYKDIYSPRIIAVDGSHVNLIQSLSNTFNPSRDKQYSTALVSSLYDVSNKIPINYTINKSKNERALFLSQLIYIKEGDTLLFDRGYYSYELLDKLLERNINFVFRLKKSSIFVVNHDKRKKDYTVTYNGRDDKCRTLRVIKYTEHTEPYYLLTNLTNKNKYTYADLKKLYKKRWLVETDFLYAKHYLSMNHLNSKKESTIKQDIALHNFILLIDGYFNVLLKKFINNKSNYKANKKVSICLFQKIIYILLYKKITKKTIKKIIKIRHIIKKSKVYVKKGRQYDRIKKRPSIWNKSIAKMRAKNKKIKTEK